MKGTAPGFFETVAPESAIFRVANLTFAYAEARPVLNDVSLALYPGQALGLVGANGSGKTTLFRCITGLERSGPGSVFLGEAPLKNDRDFQALRLQVGYVVQNADDQFVFSEVLEDVSFGPLNQGLSPAAAREAAMRALALTGMTEFAGRLCSELSGGQKRLVGLAGILAMRPRALLLDEPLNGLDGAACARLAALIKELSCAKIIVSHNRDFLRETCAGYLQLQDGRLEAKGW